MTISGTYFNGKVSLDSSPSTSRPVKVKVIFDEPESGLPLSLSDFSFSKTQELLKNIKSSFADDVIKERRESE